MMQNSRRQFLMLAAGVASRLAEAQITVDQIADRRSWLNARARTLTGMLEAMGSLPPHPSRRVEVNHLGVTDGESFKRVRISYLSEPGDHVPAYLLIPNRIRRKAPGVLCLHQTTAIGKDEPAGVGGKPNLHYAKELAERGFVAIVPDYPYLGENRFDPYSNGYLSCTMKGIVNHRRAVDVLQSMAEVDPGRIGVIGHSLGGHNALFLSVFDERLKAVVTSCGFTSFGRYFNGDLAGWAGVRYMPKIKSDFANDPVRVPFDFPGILCALAPRPIFINAPLRDSNFDVTGVKECVDAARSAYNRVFHAGAKLMAVYPDADHDFPPAVRGQAYGFLEKWLKS